jgi:hydroxyethylthiazole kinase-like sugar kinase family protein
MGEQQSINPSKAWRRVRVRRSLVARLHNHVSAGLVAQGLDALGASPAMVSDPAAAVARVTHADALSVNLGAPSTPPRRRQFWPRSRRRCAWDVPECWIP